MSRNRIIFALALLVSGCGGGTTGSQPEVRLARLEKADMSIRYVASGHVVSKTIRISTPDGGVLTELPVQLNQSVKKGQLLFQIDDAEPRQTLRSMQAEVTAARTKADENLALLGIRQQQSEIQVAQSLSDQQEAALTLEESRAGATAEERKKLREELRQAEERMKSSALDLRRKRQLFQEEIVSQADLDAAESKARLDASGYKEVLADYQGQRKGTPAVTLQRLQVKQQRAALGSDLARQKEVEESLLIHRVRAAQAEVERLQANVDRQRFLIERRHVLSPSDGVVSQFNYEAGEMALQNSQVLH